MCGSLLWSQEHHRDKLFWHIYGTLLVVPTLDEAIAYQQTCVGQNKRCPTIVCLDGNRVESSSFVDPDACLKPDAVLPFVFGALPAERTREWVMTDRAAEACSDLCTQLEAKVQLEEQDLVAGTEIEIQAKEQEVTSLKAQLDQARQEASEAAHPPRSPVAAAGATASGGPKAANKRRAPGSAVTTTKRPRGT